MKKDITKNHIGHKAVVIGNHSNHGQPYGSVFTIKKVDGTKNPAIYVEENTNVYYQRDLELKVSDKKMIKKQLAYAEQLLRRGTPLHALPSPYHKGDRTIIH